MKSVDSHARAFTLVELLVVVLIVAILAAFLIAAAKLARDSASRATCASNLHQVAAAVQAYASANAGEIPTVYRPCHEFLRTDVRWPGATPASTRTASAVSGLLLLVSQPEGLAAQGAIPDTSLLHCPGDAGWYGRNRSSYLYCYVPPGGGTYSPWYLQPAVIDPSNYHWIGGALAGLERHNLSTPQRRLDRPPDRSHPDSHRKGPTGTPSIRFPWPQAETSSLRRPRCPHRPRSSL